MVQAVSQRAARAPSRRVATKNKFSLLPNKVPKIPSIPLPTYLATSYWETRTQRQIGPLVHPVLEVKHVDGPGAGTSPSAVGWWEIGGWGGCV